MSRPLSGSMTGRPVRARRVVVAGVSATAMVAGLLGGAAARAVTGDTVADTVHPFTARVNIGAPGFGKACTGALVAPSWVLTASACFGQTTAGAPAQPTTVTLGRPIAATWVVPHPDRNLALVRLLTPVGDITPVPVATTAPSAGDVLQLVGYGRTATDWISAQKHAGAVSVETVGATTLSVAGTDPAAVTTCRGDSGGPALRGSGSTVQLVAVHHTSTQRGCLDAGEITESGAEETRVDDLSGWIQGIAVNTCNAAGTAVPTAQTGAVVYTADFTGDCKSDIVHQNNDGDLQGWYSKGNMAVDSGLFNGASRLVGSGWTTSNIQRILTGDFNGDGKADIIGQDSTGQLRAWPSSGDMSADAKLFTGAARIVGTGFSTTAFPRLLTGDFNGDGRTDLLGQNAAGQLKAWGSTGNLNGGVLFPGSGVVVGTGFTTTSIPRILTADFTGDGRTDIIGQDSTGQLRAWASSGDLSADARLLPGPVRIVGSGWTTTNIPRILTGDFTGDGRTDIIGQDSTGQLRAWASSGDLSADARLFAGQVRIVGGGWTQTAYPRIVLGDFNGDGKQDILNQNTAGELYGWASTGDLSADNNLFASGARHKFGVGWTVASYPRIL
ncbi:FG-GAP-like repeat-containing protein [Actinoplanes sp. NPDC026670]|uniref:FG-GAP-like repeat-containing protein n=1 Tax=Actinoplanes sp. NPDC026670 TaxID=3154700 RepID=UPI0033D85E16